MLRTLLALSVTAMAAMALVVFGDGNVFGAAVLSVAALLLVPPLVLGSRLEPTLAGNYLAAVVVVSLFALAWNRGGVEMSVTGWMALVPVIAGMVGRWRVGLLWCGIVVFASSTLAVGEASGWTPAASQPALLVRWLSQVGLIALSLWMVHRVRYLAQDRQRTLTERAVAGQKLESLGRLAGGIAHDFNNVLAVVLARADDAMQGMDPSDARYSDLYAIRTAAERGASLASELVAFSRRGPATYDVVRPLEVVHAALQVLGRLVRENVQIDVEADADVPPIEGDRDHLMQVVLNLVLNAQDAMPDGGRMWIQLSAREVRKALSAATSEIPVGTYAVISVRDEGVGMSTEVQTRVFEPFYTTKERGEGSGIGLATVHAIIGQHGGHVRLDSRLGSGSTFEVFLPLTSRRPQLRETTLDAPPLPESALRLLLVEDDALVRRALEVMLSRAGHVVVAAANGAEAIARFEEADEPFDVVLTDVLMPGMTGPEVVRHLRAEDPSVRVVYMSGHVEDAMRDVDLEQQKDPFVRKPASRAEVLAALQRARAAQPAQKPTLA